MTTTTARTTTVRRTTTARRRRATTTTQAIIERICHLKILSLKNIEEKIIGEKNEEEIEDDFFA